MSPWCSEGDVPTAANLKLFEGQRAHVALHCDDEPLFGGSGDPKRIVSLSLGSHTVLNGRRSSVRTVMRVRAGSTMGTFWSWMGGARTNTFTVRVPVWRIDE